MITKHHPLFRQLRSFVGVGLLCTGLHYSVLIVLVQIFRAPPVPATLCGFCIGGLLSYTLNRRHTFGSERPHEQAAWRFALVAGVAFGLTWGLMRVFVERWHAPYLPAQAVTTGLVMVWTFAANRLWTFRGERSDDAPSRLGADRIADVPCRDAFASPRAEAVPFVWKLTSYYADVNEGNLGRDRCATTLRRAFSAVPLSLSI